MTQRYDYGPFGEAQGATGSSGQPLRFAARELDATAGLYYVRARWYDAGMGRFISEDPIGLEGGINNYAYGANDPVNLSDPMGLCYGRMAVFILGEGEPCPPRMGLEFLIDRWSGIRNGDGVTATMAGAVFAALAGWQDGPENRSSRKVALSSGPDGDPGLNCGRAAAMAVVSGVGDALTLSGPYAAFRAIQGTSVVALKAAGQLSGQVAVNQARRSAAVGAFRAESGKMAMGVTQQALTTYISGDHWSYAVPLWGTGRRIVDAIKICAND